MKVAVIGGGISGLVSAYVLAKQGVDVVVYEKEDSLGGDAKTARFNGVDIDLCPIVFNSVTYPNTMEFFEKLGVEMETSDMSFSVSLDNGNGCEWGSRNGLSSLFANKMSILNPYFWKMLKELIAFKKDVVSYLDNFENKLDIDGDETMGQFIKSGGYSELFIKAYLIPICCSIWTSSSEGILNLSAYSALSFCRAHHMLQIFDSTQWLTFRGSSQSYGKKVREELESSGCQIKTGSAVQAVTTTNKGCVVSCQDGSHTYDRCIIAIRAPDALRLIEKQATYDEKRVLGAFQYISSEVYLHQDKSFMPKNPAAWSAWNILSRTDNNVFTTYWLNVLQNLGEKGEPFLVTRNSDRVPKSILCKWSTTHPIPSIAASKATLEMDQIQGKRGLWFCGAYQGNGFHEDGLKAAMVAAHDLLGKSCSLLESPKHMTTSYPESGARLFVSRFLSNFISTGALTLLEEGGTVFNFDGAQTTCRLKAVLKVHSPQFYWKIMTHADLGLADAYISGDFSFVDKDEGLLNLLTILIANKELRSSKSKMSRKRGWWTPMFFTAGIASARFFLKHILRQNTLTQARQNISQHYDLSNELFGLFLDETMTYSCAIFKSKEEDLKFAQLRKLSLLIEKARIKENHKVLEIGCGWGSLAIEVVKQSGCRYTGITLSEEQLKYCEKKVKEAGLQDRITFQLCDYRQLPRTCKYDRIISCEMLEAVGHEYLEEFFGCCESVLAHDGLMVVQFTSIPEERYDQYRRSSDFIKEYIFPGACVLSLNSVISAMASSSKLSVELVENIGGHYAQTLTNWKRKFLHNQSQVMALGFDYKFVRTWEYYFDYCTAGFLTRTLGNYQIVFSRPGNTATFGNSYEKTPSA